MKNRNNKGMYKQEESNSVTKANMKIQQEFYSDDESDDITHLGYFINSVDHDERREK